MAFSTTIDPIVRQAEDMIRPPFMARVAAGVAVTAYEETLKLPSTAVALPMTTVSQILQTSMRVQQVLTELAIKGDGLFELLGAGPDEHPEWAVFDDDKTPSTSTDTGSPARTAPAAAEAAAPAPGRFALYSTVPTSATGGDTDADSARADSAPSAPPKKAPAKKTPAKKTPAKKAAPAAKKTAAKKAAPTEAAKKAPAKKTAAKRDVTKTSSSAEIVEYLDYDSLTLAQLRARLRTLSVEELTALLDHENAHAARAPFVTMLSNRITTAGRK